jgi:hypothetical protein
MSGKNAPSADPRDEALDGLFLQLREAEPAERIPDDAASRVLAAVAADSDSDAGVVPLRPSWSRRFSTAVGVVAAVAAVVVGVVLLPPHRAADAPQVTAEPTTSATNPALPLDNPNSAQYLQAIGSKDPGALGDPARMSACLAANGLDPDKPLLGSKQITLNGEPGILLLTGGKEPGQITALVVGESCGQDGPALITRRDIG